VQRSAVHDVLRSGGRPPDETTRTDMEGRFGEDFSDVRIHDDHAAKRSAAELGARAYTSGRHVVIGSGGADRHTLAHEQTHVVQQRQGAVARTDNGSGLKVSNPSDRFERAAETHAIRVMRSATASSTAATGSETIDAAPMDSEHAELRNRPGGLPLRALGQLVNDLPSAYRVPFWTQAIALFHESLGPDTGQVRWIALQDADLPHEARETIRRLFPDAEFHGAAPRSAVTT
jgi:hypothetical protein